MTEPSDDLPDLDPRAAALLAAYRRGRAMPPGARARVHDRISGTCPEDHVLPLRRSHPDARAWAVALALAAVAVLWLAWRGPDLSQQTAAPATMSPAHGAAAGAAVDASLGAGPETGQPLPREPAAQPEPLAQPGEPVPSASRSNAPAPSTGPRQAPGAGSTRAGPVPSASRSAGDQPAASRPTADEPVPSTSLRDEQELLARGWQALAAGRARDAARDVGEHARRFPGGVLAPERRALEAAAACVDEPDRGAELARAFLADHPRSPLARRVREACELVP